MTGAFQGGNYILVEHRERKQPMQVAMVIGHHPCLLLAGTTNPPGMGGELEVAGGLLQQPLEMVPAETVDLEVPARAEIVIEGVLDTSPENLREEGALRRVSALLYRRRSLSGYQSHRDHHAAESDLR